MGDFAGATDTAAIAVSSGPSPSFSSPGVQAAMRRAVSMVKDRAAAVRRANTDEEIMGEGPESTSEDHHQRPTAPVHQSTLGSTAGKRKK